MAVEAGLTSEAREEMDAGLRRIADGEFILKSCACLNLCRCWMYVVASMFYAYQVFTYSSVIFCNVSPARTFVVYLGGKALWVLDDNINVLILLRLILCFEFCVSYLLFYLFVLKVRYQRLSFAFEAFLTVNGTPDRSHTRPASL